MVYTYLTISDLKNRASKLAREQGLSRHAALDEAARLGGFQNFAHALTQLAQAISPEMFPVEMRQRWFEREPRRRGIASIKLLLRTPLTELVKPHQLTEYLGGCAIVGAQTLVSDGSMRDRRDSLNDLSRIARVLQFMDATGLKPSRARKCYPKGDWDHRPPIADHDSCWYDPEAKAYILVTQPYPGRETRRREDHLAWERRHGWDTVQTEWGSMYGHGTEFFLLCPASYAPILRSKVSMLEKSPVAMRNEDVDPGDDALERAAA